MGRRVDIGHGVSVRPVSYSKGTTDVPGPHGFIVAFPGDCEGLVPVWVPPAERARRETWTRSDDGGDDLSRLTLEPSVHCLM